MSQPFSRHIETVPARRVNAPPFDGELARFERHLTAENRSPRTIRTYGDSVRQLHTYFEQQGMPLELAHVRREHVEAFIVSLLERWKSSTANNRYRSLQAFFKYADEEGLVSESPMARMSPPKVEEVLVPVLSERELQALLKTVSGTDFEARRDAAILRVFIDTGARLSEVAGIRLGHGDALDDDDSDLDLGSGLLRVLGKGSRWRMLTCPPRTGPSTELENLCRCGRRGRGMSKRSGTQLRRSSPSCGRQRSTSPRAIRWARRCASSG